MELWDIYTKDKVKTNRSIQRGEKLDSGDYHLVVFAFILNPNNEILISRRSLDKTFPGKWEITGGAAVLGDSSESAIIREVKEELGVKIDIKNGRCIKTITCEAYTNYIADIYLFFEDIKIQNVVCQVEEVSEAKYVSITEFIQMLEQGEFTDNTFIYEPIYQVITEAYFKSWIDVDIDRFTKLIHDECVIEECSGDVYIGKDVCLTWFKSWNTAGNKVIDWEIQKSILSTSKNEITLLWSFTCDFENKRYDFDGCSVVEFKDYKIIKIKEFQMNSNKNYPYNELVKEK